MLLEDSVKLLDVRTMVNDLDCLKRIFTCAGSDTWREESEYPDVTLGQFIGEQFQQMAVVYIAAVEADIDRAVVAARRNITKSDSQIKREKRAYQRHLRVVQELDAGAHCVTAICLDEMSPVCKDALVYHKHTYSFTRAIYWQEIKSRVRAQMCP
jgi:hypothetical protein